MIKTILKTSFFSLWIGFTFEIINIWLDTNYIHKFFKNNLITILIALLAINTTTIGIVLTKIRDLVDKNGGSSFFLNTKQHMLLSIKEQIFLIIFSIIALSIQSSFLIKKVEILTFFLNSFIMGIFVYALFVLYDTAKSVIIIIDFDGKN